MKAVLLYEGGFSEACFSAYIHDISHLQMSVRRGTLEDLLHLCYFVWASHGA